jgi:Arc/MetJ-type ribon-helix-helix transcriptional regulator
MKIITVNLPVPFLEKIDSLTGEGGLYPSRSELIRVAIRDFLIRELQAAQDAEKGVQEKPASVRIDYTKAKIVHTPSDETYVRVPNEDGTFKEYKTRPTISYPQTS